MSDKPGPPPAAAWARLLAFKEQSAQLHRELAKIEETRVDADRTVGVLVDADGRLLDLEVADEAMERLSGDELCDLIMRLYDEGSAAVEQKVREETERVYGMGFTPEQIAKGEIEVREIQESVRRNVVG